MAVVFAHATTYPNEPKVSGPDGRLVFSQLGRGEAPIFCATPCVKFVMEGEERYRVDGGVQVVRPGEFLMVDAGVALEGILPSRATTTGMCIYMPAGEALPYIPPHAAAEEGVRGPLEARAVVQSARASSFGRMLETAARRLAAGPEAGPELAAGLALSAAVEFTGFTAEVVDRLESLDAAKPSTRRDLLRRIDVARGYLHDHDDRAVPLDELASAAGMSQFHLARTFRTAYGLPPAQYHRALRLDRAAEHLAGGHDSASSAALRFGFSDLGAFSRAFRRRHGAPPGRYRPGRAALSTST